MHFNYLKYGNSIYHHIYCTYYSCSYFSYAVKRLVPDCDTSLNHGTIGNIRDQYRLFHNAI